MKMYKEESLTNFKPWAGAVCRFEVLTYSQLEQIESIFEELYPEGMDETQINDIFWFEEDTIADWLGYEDFEALERANNGEEEYEEDN